MLGPLPPKYRAILVVVALVGCIASGAWLAWFTPVPVMAPAGALIGAAAGLVAAYALVREPHPSRRAVSHRR